MSFFLLIIMGYIYFSLKNPTPLNVSTIRDDSTLLPKTEVSKSEAKKEAQKTRDPGSQLNIPQDKFSKKRVRRDENAKIMSGEYHPALPKNYRLVGNKTQQAAQVQTSELAAQMVQIWAQQAQAAAAQV